MASVPPSVHVLRRAIRIPACNIVNAMSSLWIVGHRRLAARKGSERILIVEKWIGPGLCDTATGGDVEDGGLSPTAVLRRMVEIESPTGGEAELARFVVATGRRFGLRAHLDEIGNAVCVNDAP